MIYSYALHDKFVFIIFIYLYGGIIYGSFCKNGYSVVGSGTRS